MLLPYIGAAHPSQCCSPQDLDSVETPGRHRRSQSSQIPELLSHISVCTKVLSHNLISFSVLRVKGSSQGSGLFLRKLIPIFIPVHCPDLKLFKQRQKKWQCLGAPGIHCTKMQVNLSNWSKAGSAPAGGFWCLLCSRLLPWQEELRGAWLGGGGASLSCY